MKSRLISLFSFFENVNRLVCKLGVELVAHPFEPVLMLPFFLAGGLKHPTYQLSLKVS